MKIRIIEWLGDLYLVVGFGYDSHCDPPDVLHAVPLEDTLIRSILVYKDFIKIPLSEAIEITDEKRIRAILVLFM